MPTILIINDLSFGQNVSACIALVLTTGAHHPAAAGCARAVVHHRANECEFDLIKHILTDTGRPGCALAGRATSTREWKVRTRS